MQVMISDFAAERYRHPHHACGFAFTFTHEADPRPAREQIAEGYVGGWNVFGSDKLGEGLKYDAATHTLTYPDDPPMRLIASAKLRDETLMLFEHEWMAIVQPDGSYEISRMD